MLEVEPQTFSMSVLQATATPIYLMKVKVLKFVFNKACQSFASWQLAVISANLEKNEKSMAAHSYWKRFNFSAN